MSQIQRVIQAPIIPDQFNITISI